MSTTNEIQTILSSATVSSPRKYRILQGNDIPQPSKILQVDSADNKSFRKSKLKEVIQLIQNTMQKLSVFEKQFTKH